MLSPIFRATPQYHNLNLRKIHANKVLLLVLMYSFFLRMELDQQNTTDVFAQQESYISAGVQDSVSSYLSLAGVEEKKRHSWKRKKWRSVYSFQRPKMYSMVTEDEDNVEEYYNT